ncbi:MAG TPA: hypothetical protein V6D19_07170 [Stenomitos sp.]
MAYTYHAGASKLTHPKACIHAVTDQYFKLKVSTQVLQRERGRTVCRNRKGGSATDAAVNCPQCLGLVERFGLSFKEEAIK